MVGRFLNPLPLAVITFCLSVLAFVAIASAGRPPPTTKPPPPVRYECDITVLRVYPRADGAPVSMPINPCGYKT